VTELLGGLEKVPFAGGAQNRDLTSRRCCAVHAAEKRWQMEPREKVCPVCMRALRSDGDEALKCPNGHGTCLVCAAAMVTPCGDCKPGCSGLWWTCPLCRNRSSLRPPFLLALLQKSWAKANGLHASDDLKDRWIAKCAIVTHARHEA
jgi:hypothetical protein